MKTNNLNNTTALIDFKNKKRADYINHCMKSAVIGSLDPERLSYVKNILDEAFQVGFDFGLDAAEEFLIPKPINSFMVDGEISVSDVLDLMEKAFEKVRAINYPPEPIPEPTPEQLTEFELENKQIRISNLALRLLEIPHLYGDMMQRGDAMQMAIHDAVVWDKKIGEAMK